MYKVIYTKSLDNADSIEAHSNVFDTTINATQAFDRLVKSLVDEMLQNSYLDCKMSIHNNKALIKIESTHHCIVIEGIN